MQKMCPRQMEATSLNGSGCQKRRLSAWWCEEHMGKKKGVPGECLPPSGRSSRDRGCPQEEPRMCVMKGWRSGGWMLPWRVQKLCWVSPWELGRSLENVGPETNPFLFFSPLFADLTLSQLIRHRPRLAFLQLSLLSFPQSHCPIPHEAGSGETSVCLRGGLCLPLLWHRPLVWGLSGLWMFALLLDVRPFEDRKLVLFITSLQVSIMVIDTIWELTGSVVRELFLHWFSGVCLY